MLLATGSTPLLLEGSAYAFYSAAEPLVTAMLIYGTSANTVRRFGIPVMDLLLDGELAIDLDAMADVSRGASLVYLYNPDNPCGAAHGRAAVEVLAAVTAHEDDAHCRVSRYALTLAQSVNSSGEHYMPARSLIALGLLACAAATGSFAQESELPRTQWGQPDLQGVWNFSSDVPMQRPEHFGTRQFLTEDEIAEIQAARAAQNASTDAAIAVEGVDASYNDFWVESAGLGDTVRTSHIIYPEDGRLPPLVEGAIANQGVYGGATTGESRPVRIAAGGIGTDGPEDRGLSERCLVGFNAGPPFTPSLYNNNVQIVQSRDTAIILTEMIHDARIVPLYDSAEDLPTLEEDIGLYTGDSKGYWDGDTLVVVTRNFNGLAASFGSSGTSNEKVLTERFTRVGYDTVNYEFTVEDPATYTDKITAIVPMTKVAGLLYEYACHEGNYGMVNVLRGARVEERMAVQGEL